MEQDKVNCPFCNESYEVSKVKIIKEWTRGIEKVKRVKCPSCGELHRIYSGTKQDGTEYLYTMRAP